MKEMTHNNAEQRDSMLQREAIMDEIDLRSIIQVLNKWRWYIVLIVFLSLISAGLISFFVIVPVFEAGTSIMVVQTRPAQQYRETGIEETVAELSRLPEITINNVVRQIKNPEIMSRVIGALKLDRELFTTGGLMAMTTVRGDADARGGGSSIIDITVQHTDPAMAALLANTIREQYLAFVSEINYEQMSASLAFLDEQIAQAEASLSSKTEELKNFDEQPRGVLFLEKEIESKAATINQHRSIINQLTIDYEKFLAARDQLRLTLAATPQFIEITRPAVLPQAGREGAQALDATVMGDAPVMGETTITFQELNPIHITISQSLSEQETEVAMTAAQIAATQRMIDQLRPELDLLQAEYTEKKTRRDFIVTQLELAQTTFSLLSERHVQTRISQAVDLGRTNFLTITTAEAPGQPISPRIGLNMAIAMVLGLMAGLFLSFFLEMMDNTIKTPDDVQKHLGLTVMGTIPLRRKAIRGTNIYARTQTPG
jgi:capsular polysaccharide biosynthesis protein